jgi:endonuclease/exonuclease/phosphatase family metal-dependent hydrolase
MRILIALIALALMAGAQAATAAELRAITYNIRFDTEADGANAWRFRRDALIALIKFYAPDLLGMQEVLLSQRNQLAENLPDYAFLGVGRDDGAEAGEFSPLAYRRDRFDLDETGAFWLSQTPERPSVGWDAALPRLVTWARLRVRANGASVLVLATHWDHVGVEARANSARLMLSWIGEHRRACESVILMGDLNAHPGERSYRELASGGILLDARAISATPPFGPAGTFNGFDISRAEAEPIDYVLVSNGVSVARHAVITQHAGGRLPSDHYPVLADLRVPEICTH